MLLSILCIAALPFCKELIKNDRYVFGDNYNLFFYSFVTIFFCLGIIGSMPATFPYVDAGQILSVLYFLNIIIFFI
jgi:hypothetical protein